MKEKNNSTNFYQALAAWGDSKTTSDLVALIAQIEDPNYLHEIQKFINSNFFNHSQKYKKIDLWKSLSSMFKRLFPHYELFANVQDDYLNKIKSALSQKKYEEYRLHFQKYAEEDSFNYIAQTDEFLSLDKAITKQLQRIDAQAVKSSVKFRADDWHLPSFSLLLLLLKFLLPADATNAAANEEAVTPKKSELLYMNDILNVLRSNSPDFTEVDQARLLDEIGYFDNKLKTAKYISDMDLSSEDALTFLNSAILNNQEDFIKIMIDKGIKVNDVSKKLKVDLPLAVACRNGQLNIVKILVEYGGADLNARSLKGRTIVAEAIFAKQLDIVKYLLDMGVNTLIEEAEGVFPLYIAIQKDEYEISKLIYKYNTGNELSSENYLLFRETFYEFLMIEKHEKTTKLPIDPNRLSVLIPRIKPHTIYEKDLLGLIYIQRAQLNYDLKKMEQVIADFEEGIKYLIPQPYIYIKYATIINAMILADYKKDHVENAIKILEEGVARFPKDLQLKTELLKTISSIKNQKKALELAGELVEDRVPFAEPYAVVALNYLKSRKYTLARLNYEKAKEYQPNDKEINQALDSLNYLLDEKNTLAYILRQDLPTLFDRIISYPVSDKLLCETLKDLSQDGFLIKNPLFVSFDYRLINLKFKNAKDSHILKNFQQSIKTLHEIIETIPHDDPYFNKPLAIVYALLGINYEAIANMSKAIEALQIAVALSPDLYKSIPILNIYARLEEEGGSINKAKRVYRIIEKMCEKPELAQQEEACSSIRSTQFVNDDEYYQELRNFCVRIFIGASIALVIKKIIFALCYRGEVAEPNPKKASASSNPQDEIFASFKILLEDFYLPSIKNQLASFVLRPGVTLTLPDYLQTPELKTVTLDPKAFLATTISVLNTLSLHAVALIETQTITFALPKENFSPKQMQAHRTALWRSIINASPQHQNNVYRNRLSRSNGDLINFRIIAATLKRSIKETISLARGYLDSIDRIVSHVSNYEKTLSSYHKLMGLKKILNEKLAAIEGLYLPELTELEKKYDECHSYSVTDSESLNRASVQLRTLENELDSIKQQLANINLTLENLRKNFADIGNKYIAHAKEDFIKDREMPVRSVTDFIDFLLNKVIAEVNAAKLKEIERKKAVEAKKKWEEEKPANLAMHKQQSVEKTKKQPGTTKKQLKSVPAKPSQFFAFHDPLKKSVPNEFLQVAIDHIDFINQIVRESAEEGKVVDLSRKIVFSEGLQYAVFKAMRALNQGVKYFKVLSVLTDAKDYGKIANVIMHDNYRRNFNFEILRLFAKTFLKNFRSVIQDTQKGQPVSKDGIVTTKLFANFLFTTVIKNDANAKIFNEYEKHCMQGILVQLHAMRHYLQFADQKRVAIPLLEKAFENSLFIIRVKSYRHLLSESLLKRYQIIDERNHFQNDCLKFKDRAKIEEFCTHFINILEPFVEGQKFDTEQTLLSLVIQSGMSKKLLGNLKKLSEPDSFVQIEQQYTKVCLEEIMMSLKNLVVLNEVMIEKRLAGKGYHAYFNDGVLQCAIKMLVLKIGQYIKDLPHEINERLTQLAPKDLLMSSQGVTFFVYFRDKIGHDFTDEQHDAKHYFIFEDISPEQLRLISKLAQPFLDVVQHYYQVDLLEAKVGTGRNYVTKTSH